MSNEERSQCDDMLADLKQAIAENNKSEIERNIEDFDNEFWTADLTIAQWEYINNVKNEARIILNN